jgi:ADP-heptose:LPS heptosyltransferase
LRAPSAYPEGGKPGRRLHAEPQRPVLFHFNGFGDRLLALPAVRALARRFLGRLTVVGGRGDRELFYLDLPVRDVLEIEFSVAGGGREFDAAALARLLRGTDLLISLNTWHNARLDELLDHLPDALSMGFSSRFAIELAAGEEWHASDRFFAAATFFDPALGIEDFAQPPAPSPEAAAVAQRVRSLVPPEARILVVHTETLPEKMWPLDQMKALVDEFLTAHADFLALVLDKRNAGLDGIREGERVVPLAGLPLGAAMALTRGADLFLGVDSCLLHFADLARIPGVGLYGPTDPHRWGFRFGPHRHVHAGGGMEQIDVADVRQALESLLEQATPRDPEERLGLLRAGAGRTRAPDR